jgi:O-antigen/teichoic acid export membrane protein
LIDCVTEVKKQLESDHIVTEPSERVALRGGITRVNTIGRFGRLRTAVAWMFAGNVVYAGCQWLILILATKLTNPSSVGHFALALALTAPFILFANLHLRTMQASDAGGQYRFEDYLRLRVVATGAALLGIAVVVTVVGYDEVVVLFVAIIAVSKAIEAMMDVLHGLMQQQGRMDRMAQSFLIRGPSSVLVVAATLFITGDLVAALAAMTVVWLLLLVVFDWPVARSCQAPARRQLNVGTLLREGWKPVHTLFFAALPLGFVAMLVSLTPNIPRYFIERLLGASELGFYAAAAYVLVAGRTVVSAVGQAAVPRLGMYVREQHWDGFSRLMLQLVAVGAMIGVAGILVVALWGRSILTLLYAPEYAEQNTVFLWLMISAGLSYVAGFLWYGLVAVGQIRVQVPFYGAVAVICFLACYLLVPRFGSVGAAAALAIAIAFQVLATAALLWKAVPGCLRVSERELAGIGHGG